MNQVELLKLAQELAPLVFPDQEVIVEDLTLRWQPGASVQLAHGDLLLIVKVEDKRLVASLNSSLVVQRQRFDPYAPALPIILRGNLSPLEFNSLVLRLTVAERRGVEGLAKDVVNKLLTANFYRLYARAKRNHVRQKAREGEALGLHNALVDELGAERSADLVRGGRASGRVAGIEVEVASNPSGYTRLTLGGLPLDAALEFIKRLKREFAEGE